MNRPRLLAAMRRAGLDAVIATSPENVTYGSGFWYMSQWIRRGPQAYVLTPAEQRGEPALVVATGALDLVADQDVEVGDVRRYGFFAVESNSVESECERRLVALLSREGYPDAIAALVSALKDRGLEAASIGLDEGGISLQSAEALGRALPRARFSPAAALFRYVRAVKTAEEVERLERSAHIAEASIAAALGVAHAGATERELANAFHGKTIAEGATPVLGVICSGPRSAFSSGQPGERALAPGDVIRFDVGGRYRHYRADIARVAVLGEPSPKVKIYHRAIRAGLLRAYDLVRPGVRTADVFQAVVETVRAGGIPHYQRSHVGHGIGLDGYDAPSIAPGSDEVFEEGMVICVETPYYELGFAGLQVEDTLLVTRGGVRSLMSTSSELRVVG